jgi:hypothetical protein
MTPPTTWEACAAAGMTATEAARHLGKSRQSGRMYAKRHGFEFPKNPEERRENLRRMHNDPVISAKRSAGVRASWRNAERKRLSRNGYSATLEALTEAERADYKMLRMKYLYRRDEALKAIGRTDLVQP